MMAVQFVASVLGAWFFLHYLPGEPLWRGGGLGGLALVAVVGLACAWAVTKLIVLARYGWAVARTVRFDR
jgi:hypothetical protein